MSADRYSVIKARPDGDPLGESDRLIVDADFGMVVAIVYSPGLAEAACDAFAERDGWPDAPDTLHLGPLTGGDEDERAVFVDLTHGGYVEVRRADSESGARLIRHEVWALHAALGAWMERTKSH